LRGLADAPEQHAIAHHIFLRRFRDHDFRREQQACRRGCVLQRQARDLGRVEDALFECVAVLAGASILAVD